MSDCCTPSNNTLPVEKSISTCPLNGKSGKLVGLVTLKSLLIPTALEQINAESIYRFCASSDCPVVYFSENQQVFNTYHLKVPVFQKDQDEEVPACYCFGWTRQRIRKEIEEQGQTQAIASISSHIKAKRCGCEFNNPQGYCCLANVRVVINR
ncbi:MAG: (2Fe-2S)-binding protein [Oscillatoriales cyanobacterium CG2_30_44_21]|nr:MAG: (2Fe-2S)-binding protein [Oscillatoriales cyanobacterium CG2_30_44_21]